MKNERNENERMKKKCASSFPTLRSLPVRPLAVDSTKQETQRYAVLSLGYFFGCVLLFVSPNTALGFSLN